MYIEAEKIRSHSFDSKNRPKRPWVMLEKIVNKLDNEEGYNDDVGATYLSALLGRTFDETKDFVTQFDNADKVNSLFKIVYWLGKRSQEEFEKGIDREISFSFSLREKLGHHIFGEQWANKIKKVLHENGLLDRPIHIISANMHSVTNALFAKAALGAKFKEKGLEQIAVTLSREENRALMGKVFKYANKKGLIEVEDSSGTNIAVQIIDCSGIDMSSLPEELTQNCSKEIFAEKVIIVMDYAFGEQAYEAMDELLKPYELDDRDISVNIKSIAIMGKAGILGGSKGDIMIPTAHIFEGSADNYPINNALKKEDFEGNGIAVYEGPMITVLGTSLQNRDILSYFLKSSWSAIGLEMEGAHYQKAIQVASKIRNSISSDVTLRYAYYASDNPLRSGSTLASGSLGLDGVAPTYAITVEILKGILNN